MCKVIAIANNKGGTSKTTSAISLAGALAKRGYRVLLVDADPQANATEACGYDFPDELDVTIATIMKKIIKGQDIEEGEGILKHPEGFDLMPSSIDLSEIEMRLVNSVKREMKLQRYITMMKPFYEFIIIDCMPSLGMITTNVLACADSVLIPVQASYLPVKGLEMMMKTILMVRNELNSDLEIEGILMVMVDKRLRYAKEIMQTVHEIYGEHVKIFKQSIPLSVRASETAAEGRSIITHDPKGKVSMAYEALAMEVLANG